MAHCHHQRCRLCGTEKPLSEFYVRKDTNKHRSECKLCMIELHRYKNIGVCNTRYDEMLVIQKGACAICKSELNSSRYTKFAVDHDHRTGKVRGLLCLCCNTALGLMKDSKERLQAAITYLGSCEDIVCST